MHEPRALRESRGVVELSAGQLALDSFKVRSATRRLSRLSSRSRYSRHRSPRYRNPISSRPRLLSSHAICPSPHHRRLKRGPVNHDLASDVTHALARSESAKADPIINRFHREARAIRGLGDVEIVARLEAGGNLSVGHLRSPPELVCPPPLRHTATPLPHSNGATQGPAGKLTISDQRRDHDQRKV